MHEKHIDQLFLFLKRGDAIRTEKITPKTRGKARLYMKRPVKNTMPHKIRITPEPPP